MRKAKHMDSNATRSLEHAAKGAIHLANTKLSKAKDWKLQNHETEGEEGDQFMDKISTRKSFLFHTTN